MDCTAKHTKYDPPPEEFRCPKCDAECGDFAIDEPAGGADSECEKLHSEDRLFCHKCRYATTGRAFAAAIAKKKNLVPCPTCKGHGMIKGPPPL